MKKSLVLFSLLIVCANLFAQTSVLITNVEIFKGNSQQTSIGNILIEGDVIKKISTEKISTEGIKDLQVIDGQGKFLMPGLIDAHWHAFMCANSITDMLFGDLGYAFMQAAVESEHTLMRGFTTVRDMAGPTFGMKKAIDRGIMNGPRIYPSGSMISQTSGHGDFRTIHEKPISMGGHTSYPEVAGASTIADGKDAVLTATRENLRLGASQIKLAAGGGVASDYDPIDVTQYTEEEIKAAVDAAADWGTYVSVHVYTPTGIQRALRAGVKCIEHAQLADEASMKMIADKGAWACIQPFDGTYKPSMSSESNAKRKLVSDGTAKAYEYAKKYKVKLAFGTDLLFDPKATHTQNAELLKLSPYFNNYEILKMATADNGQLLTLSGPRNPYPKKLGVIEEGAYADLIIIDGNPLKDLKVITEYNDRFKLIMQGGVIKKNTIQ